MGAEPLIAKPAAQPAPAAKEPAFGVNEMRLNARQWLAALGIVGLALFLTPRLWETDRTF